MNNRNIILLMNNFSAHELAIENIKKDGGLKNIKIILLFNNSISLHQSLDQGIIKNVKIYYRKYWLEYVLDKAEQERNSLSTINILKIVQFFCKTWQLNIKSKIIVNC